MDGVESLLNDASPAGVARRIKATRLARGLRTGELAVRIGVSQPAVSNWETRPKSRPDIDEAIRLAEALGCSLDWLYRGTRDSIPDVVLQKLRPPRSRTG